jgi:TonB family protein
MVSVSQRMRKFAALICLTSTLCGQDAKPSGDAPFDVGAERARREAIKRAKDGIVEPVLIKNVPIELPPEAKKPGFHGVVEVMVYIDADGTVTSAEISKSTNHVLDAAVVSAVRQQRYIPGKRKGKAVPYGRTITFYYPPLPEPKAKDEKKD